ncbi:dienelactone hydrolase family protein [Bradyrhizobium tropiciagri]|uniref:dienelactone hydrolase family protein n=1 Tax=Bradyrhizobium tropiciagri TaxID=312253 RepID=UPI00067AC165|nr:dienelactone hydrolase family protein [Bradyrhizobium tropiciagri]
MAVTAAVVLSVAAAPPPIGPLPDRVTFPSADGQTTLVGYVFKPEGPHAARSPAVVMMHGRAGPYSSLANGRYDASTLSQRHQKWGHLWAQQGYLAILVDGFGPRGFPEGFTHQSYEQRPESVNEVIVRPYDAYGAVAYLRTRNDVAADHIALQGWSNGASATLSTMSSTTPALASPSSTTGFRGALAFYPGCGLKGKFKTGLIPYAPVHVFVGTADEEISPQECSDLVDKSRTEHANISLKIYPGATHDFDDPSASRQDNPANVAATRDATADAIEFFAAILRH